MKKSLFVILIAGMAVLAACSSDNQSREKQDSIEAAAAADSMLKDATQSADTTLTTDSIVVDTADIDN